MKPGDVLCLRVDNQPTYYVWCGNGSDTVGITLPCWITVLGVFECDDTKNGKIKLGQLCRTDTWVTFLAHGRVCQMRLDWLAERTASVAG